MIGGGAAGFLAAITCAETNPDAQVILLEGGREPLAKVRVSGGGRCNVTHSCFDPSALVQNYPRGAKALRGAFSRFQPQDTIAWFAARGVTLKTEPDGRMFPTTDDSATIVDCLMTEARMAGVKIRAGAMVKSVEKIDGTFRVVLRSGDEWVCDRLLLATGSSPQGYQIAKSLGHTLEPPVPSLFTLTIRDPRLQELAGVSVNQAHLKLQVAGDPPTKLEQTGPALITHWGLSGPAVLKLSAWGARALHAAHYQAQLTINWLPTYNADKLRQELLKVKSQLAKRSVSANCPVMLPRRLWEHLTIAAGISPQTRWADVSKAAINALIQELLQGQYVVSGKGVFKDEFVTCGGVNLKEVDFKTLESRICPGLYFAGEVLDIDGVTGGFNFQSAWTTGWLAGNALGQPKVEPLY